MLTHKLYIPIKYLALVEDRMGNLIGGFYTLVVEGFIG